MATTKYVKAEYAAETPSNVSRFGPLSKGDVVILTRREWDYLQNNKDATFSFVEDTEEFTQDVDYVRLRDKQAAPVKKEKSSEPPASGSDSGGGGAPPRPVLEKDGVYTPEELLAYTVEELRDLAKVRGVRGYYNMREEKLVKRLVEEQG